MEHSEVLQRIRDQSLIAIVRTPDAAPLIPIAEALYTGGVEIIEFTLTVPGALEALSRVRAVLPPHVVLGVGTVLDTESARAAILAGAQFIVMPTLDRGTIRTCHRYSVPVIPGAFTPTEVLRAWEWGGDLIKVFPASVVGPDYCRAIHGPLPHIPLVPVGGITLDSVADYLRAGAAAVGVGGSLVGNDLVCQQDWGALTRKAQAFIQQVQEVREARDA